MTTVTRLRRALSLVVCLVLTSLVVVEQPATATSTDPLRRPTTILLLGDSITQGSTGDYTWRYFAAKALTSSGASFDFVGPSSGLYDGVDRPDSMAYVDPSFDTDHAARWGNALAWPRWTWEQLAPYAPDVTVIFLGFNDMAIFQQTPDEVVERLESGIAAMRAVNPATRVVVVPPPGAGASMIPSLNARLHDWAANSPIPHLVLAAEVNDYQLGSPTDPEDTWDGLHPDTSGQVKMAAAVTDALAQSGVGTGYPRPLTFPAEGLRTPAVLASSVGPGHVLLTWTNPPGATSTIIWQRDRGEDSPWTVIARGVPGQTWPVAGLIAGHTYEFRTQSVKGWVPAEALYSDPVHVTLPEAATPTPAPSPVVPTVPTPVAAAEAAPVATVPVVAPLTLSESVPPVSAVDVKCGKSGVCRVSWPEVPGATGYQIAFRATGTPWSTTPVQSGTTWSHKMSAHSRLLVRVRPRADDVMGAWSATTQRRTCSNGH